MRCYYLMGTKVSVQDDEKGLEMDSGDGCRTYVNILNAIELYTYKW